MMRTGLLFQRIIEKVMGNFQPRFLSMYNDNTTVYSLYLRKHVAALNVVFYWLKNQP